jgi:nitrate reductase delta subunit
MAIFDLKPRPMATTLRVLAHLLSYPGAELREHLPELREALHAERALGDDRLAELDLLIDRLSSPRSFDTEAGYVELFDRGRGTSLHLFEHVHGDSRDRGPAMVDLLQTYEQAGLYLAPGELPDYLPAVLEYASTQPPKEAGDFLREIAALAQVIFSALLRRESAYASVLAALLDLAGEKAQAVKLPAEEGLDESWEEPAAFGGCSTQGQASPAQPQPIQIVRRAPGRDAQPNAGARP